MFLKQCARGAGERPIKVELNYNFPQLVDGFQFVPQIYIPAIIKSIITRVLFHKKRHSRHGSYVDIWPTLARFIPPFAI